MAIVLRTELFTDSSDRLDKNQGLIIEGNSIVNTQAGSDRLFADASGFESDGIYNSGTLHTQAGNDRIIAISWTAGIFNRSNSILTTGSGHDRIRAEGGAIGIENVSDGIIDTGSGSDYLYAEGGEAGYLNSGTISTGSGSDELLGISSRGDGLFNAGRIEMESGRDKLLGFGSRRGIANYGVIDMGTGRDFVSAEADEIAQGFLGEGTIRLGPGNDRISGFGTQIIDGGQGSDTAVLRQLSLADVEIYLGQEPNSVVMIGDSSIGGQMKYIDIEAFIFSDQQVSLGALESRALHPASPIIGDPIIDPPLDADPIIVPIEVIPIP